MRCAGRGRPRRSGSKTCGKTERIGYPRGRFRQVTPDVVRKVKRWKGTKAEIAGRLDMSRQTVYAILNQA